MLNQSSFKKLTTVLLLCTLVVGFVSGDDDEKEVIERDALGLTIPNPFGETPLFETNNQNGRYFGMHIPGGLMDTKFEQTFISGVMSMTWDRMSTPDGERHGPIKFSVFGLSLYDNKEQPIV